MSNAISPEIREEIEKRSILFETVKDQIIEDIRNNTKILIDKLKAAENKIIKDVEAEFAINPFSNFLGSNNYTDERIKYILSKRIPTKFGPDEESFHNIIREIESLKSWREKKEDNSSFELIPKNLTAKDVSSDEVSISWDKVNCNCFYKIELKSSMACLEYHSAKPEYTIHDLEPKTKYYIRVCAIAPQSGSQSIWSDPIAFQTKPAFSECTWKEYPDYVGDNRKYSIRGANQKIATKVDDGWCTIVGSTPLPPNKVTSWNIKILKSKNNNGGDIHIGVAPFDIDQNDDHNYKKCGWYFYCYNSSLWSGPSHNCKSTSYGPRKEDGKYVHTGDSVGVMMDIKKGELSFVLNGVNLGVAYEKILLDKPLVPCVLLWNKDDSVELNFLVKNNMNRSISVPSRIAAMNTSWNSITLAWDAVDGASFYQVETDGSISTVRQENKFTKRGLLPETDCDWSGVVKKRTQKETFETSEWKECPDYVDENRKYFVDENNSRIVVSVGTGWSTIVGNTSLPLNKVSSWNIKILKSVKDDGGDIHIGVAPFDVNQDECNYKICGWYFYCGYSGLWSGPPHNFKGKKYGPRKGEGEKYVHTGDNVGVVMDTTKGRLSFVLNRVNLGVAYEEIPLDKPLVPCVLLRLKDDSVELVL